jgi:hypothetical protein
VVAVVVAVVVVDAVVVGVVVGGAVGGAVAVGVALGVAVAVAVVVRDGGDVMRLLAELRSMALRDLLSRRAYADAYKEAFVEEWLVVGQSYYIRTLGFNYTGRLKAILHDVLILEDAAWIAEDARFHNSLSTGEFREIEPYVDAVAINRAIIEDVTPFRHPLPREVK